MIMDSKYLTDDELISAINHSSEPYIIVEGPDDVMIYRWILDDINCTAMLEPRGGCGEVKKLYVRCHEIKNPKVIFICDRDTLVYTNVVPKEYQGMIYTEGYSIENDLYQGKSFEKQYFRKKDKMLFEKSLNEFLLYYACEFEKFQKGIEFNFDESPEKIILENDGYILDTSNLINYKEPSPNTIDYIKNGYDLLLRGHSLFHLIRKIMARPDRGITYSLKQIYEICYNLKSDSIKRLQNRIKSMLTSFE